MSSPSAPWNGSKLLPAYGGTGVANNAANTITLSGSYALTITLSNTTSVTFPASGTLATAAGNVATATALQTARNLWGQSFDGTANVTGSLMSVADITGGASSMIITSGTGNSRTMTLKTTTSGGTATTALTLAADQSATFANTVNATTFVGALTGNASGSSGSCTGNAATATALATGRTISITGDLAYTSASFDGTGNVTGTGTLASILTAGGPTGSASTVPIITWDAKGRLTAVSSATIVASTATALASSRTLWGQSFDGTGNVSGSLTAVADITGGASSMTVTAGTGNSRTLTLKTTTSGGTATTALTLAADQSATFANTVNATTFVGALTGNASGSSGSCTGNAATATALATGRTISITGDMAYTSGSFDGTGNVTGTGTLTSILTAGGPTGAAGTVPIITWDAKGRLTAVSSATIVAATATALASARTLWGRSFDGTANVSGSLTAVADITGGASSMTITAGTGNSRTMVLKTTTSGGTATTALTLGADQSATVAGTIAASNLSGTNTGDQTTVSGNAGTATTLQTARNLWGQSFDGSAAVTGSLTSVGSITGGASSMTITAGTGNSRTLTLQTTTSGGTATTAVTIGADQSTTFAGMVTMPTPFTLGATSVTSTGTQLNYLNAATGTTGTASTSIVFSASPALSGTPTTPSTSIAAIPVNGLKIANLTYILGYLNLLASDYIYGYNMAYASTSTVTVTAGKVMTSGGVIKITSATTVDVTSNGAASGNDAFTGPGTVATNSANAIVTGISTTFTTSFGSRAASGTSSSSGGTLTGTSSKFLTEVAIGDLIGTVSKGFFQVTAIASDTSLTLVSTPGSAFSSDSMLVIENPTIKVNAQSAVQVKTIASDTSLTTTSNSSATESGVAYIIGLFNKCTVPATNQCFIYMWVGMDTSSGTAVFVSTQRTTPYGITYNYFRRVGSVLMAAGLVLPFENFGSNNDKTYQYEFAANTNNSRLLSGGTSTTYVAIVASAVAPPSAKMLLLSLVTTGTVSSTTLTVRARNMVSGDSTTSRPSQSRLNVAGLYGNYGGYLCDNAQAIEYIMVNAGSATIECNGFVESL